jgi:hypothetical protein
MTKRAPKTPGYRSARTRSRRTEAVAAVRAANGDWVDLPGLNGSDLLYMQRDVALEIEMVASGDGRYSPRGRVNVDRVESYRKLQDKLWTELQRDAGFGLNREGVQSAQRALAEFLEPRRVG